jgi:DNA invertase Pin-like site-specific DNA recombinase
MSDAVRRAGIYVRISSDPTGRRLGVTRQRDACREKARELGWDVVSLFEDNDVSASTGRRRPAYSRMLEGLRAGELDAVVVWDLDRLTRRPMEIEEFIELADRHGVALASVGGEVDLATDNGRLFARIKGAVARAEAERKGARQKAANAQRRRTGALNPGGLRTFGYQPGGQAVVRAEAAAVRQAAARLIGGATISEIARWLTGTGMLSTAGNPWQPYSVRRMLANPRYAGWVTHHGQRVVRGSWPPILDDRTQAAVLAALQERAAAGTTKYLLTGIARCSVCRRTVSGTWDSTLSAPIYRCPSRAHLSRRTAPLDRHVESQLLARAAQLHSPDPDAAAERMGRLQERDMQLRARLDRLSEAFADGGIDEQQLRAGTARLRARRNAAAGDLIAASASASLARLRDAPDPAATWAAMPIRARRSIVRQTLSIDLLPPGRGSKIFRPAREIALSWRD